MDAHDEMIVANRGDQPTYKELEDLLSASQAREAELREKLAEMQADVDATNEGHPLRRMDEFRKLLESKVPDGFELVKSSLLSAFPEINLSNYGDDEVRAINQWGIDIVTSAQPKEPKQ